MNNNQFNPGYDDMHRAMARQQIFNHKPIKLLVDGKFVDAESLRGVELTVKQAAPKTEDELRAELDRAMDSKEAAEKEAKEFLRTSNESIQHLKEQIDFLAHAGDRIGVNIRATKRGAE